MITTSTPRPPDRSYARHASVRYKSSECNLVVRYESDKLQRKLGSWMGRFRRLRSL